MTAAEPTSDQPRGLRIGFVAGVTVTKWRRIWTERYPRLPLTVIEVGLTEQRAVLDAGEIDLCFVRLPVDQDQLHVITLYDEVGVVVVPKDHPAALFDEVSRTELADENVLDDRDHGLAMDLVAGGAGVLFVPHAIARSHSRRDLVYRPVTDAEPTTIALAWRTDNEHPLIQDFIGVVRGRTVNSSRTAQSGGTTPAPRKDRPGRPVRARVKRSKRR